MLRLLKEKNALRYMLLYLVVVLVFFGIFVRTDYATDTFADILSDPRDMFAHFMGSGRFVVAGFYAVFVKLGVSFEVVYGLSFVCAIIALTLALYCLRVVLKRYLNDKRALLVLPIVILINPFTIELFLYAEKGIMVLSLLAGVLATLCFTEYLKKDKGWNWLLAALGWAFVAVCCYQGTLGITIVLMTLCILLEQKKNAKKFCKWTIISIAIYGLAAVLNLGITKIYAGAGARVAMGSNLGQNIAEIFSKSGDLLGYYRIIPGMLMPCLMIALLLMVIVYTAQQHKWKSLSLSFLKILYVGVVAYLAAVVPQVTQEGVWMVARSSYSFAMFFGVMEIILAVDFAEALNSKIAGFAVGVVNAVLMSVLVVRFNTIALDHYTLNALDKQRAITLGDMIDKYELNHSGVAINRIAFYGDATATGSYPGLFASGDINLSAFFPDWSDALVVNYWTGRNLTRIENEVAREECAQKNWDVFSEEQVRFAGDTVYVCKF